MSTYKCVLVECVCFRYFQASSVDQVDIMVSSKWWQVYTYTHSCGMESPWDCLSTKLETCQQLKCVGVSIVPSS
jgi:hypothetical protein